MNDYLKLNQDRWNKVRNDYTEPLTHEELEEASYVSKSGVRLFPYYLLAYIMPPLYKP